MKYFNFKNKKSKDLSEWEAYKLKSETSQEEQLPLRKYELIRTKEFVLYVLNKRTRTKYSIKINRCLALLARKHNCLIKYYEKDMAAYTEDNKNLYIFADKVRNEQELGYHRAKFVDRYGAENIEIISLQKSDICPFIELDFDTIRNYYKTYKFPDWFKPYIKMRHFRICNTKLRFVFTERRLTDTSKHSADEKYRRDLLKVADPCKCYFSLCRFLDSKKEQKGLGYAIRDLTYFALDVDGKCKNDYHLVDQNGICVNCLIDAKIKVAKVKKRLEEYGKIKVIKELFSGGKGFHLHNEFDGKRELSQKQFLDIINFINKEEELVDTFIFERNGEEVWDEHRIFRTPLCVSGDSCCIVKEGEITRLPVKDEIIYPKQKPLYNKL